MPVMHQWRFVRRCLKALTPSPGFFVLPQREQKTQEAQAWVSDVGAGAGARSPVLTLETQEKVAPLLQPQRRGLPQALKPLPPCPMQEPQAQ